MSHDPTMQVLKEGQVTPASDVYSFAILLYEMYARRHLFKGLLHSQACAHPWLPCPAAAGPGPQQEVLPARAERRSFTKPGAGSCVWVRQGVSTLKHARCRGGLSLET